MHIAVENLPSLMAWLSKELGPLCDADSGTLAQYVVALLKNEKETEQLKAHCIDQLNDFLKDQTATFVKNLFRVLLDNSYVEVSTHAVNAIADDDDDDEGGSRRIGFGRQRAYDDDDDGGYSWRRGGRNRNMRRSSSDPYYSDDDDGNKRRRFDDGRYLPGGHGDRRGGEGRGGAPRKGDDRHADMRKESSDRKGPVAPPPGARSVLPPSQGMPYRDHPGPMFGGQYNGPMGMMPYRDNFGNFGHPMGGGMMGGPFPGMNMHNMGMMGGFQNMHGHGGPDPRQMMMMMGGGGGPDFGMPFGGGGAYDPSMGPMTHPGGADSMRSQQAGHRPTPPSGPAPSAKAPSQPTQQQGGNAGGVDAEDEAGASTATAASTVSSLDPSAPPFVPGVGSAGGPAGAGAGSDGGVFVPPPPLAPMPTTSAPSTAPSLVDGGAGMGTLGNMGGMFNSYNPAGLMAPIVLPTLALGQGQMYVPQYSGQFDNWNKPRSQLQPGGHSGQGGHYHHHAPTGTHLDLPEDERCTLKVQGLPRTAKIEDIRNHFRSFGRVVELQITQAPEGTADGDKKVFNDGLVQFATAQEAKKCFSSPLAVLNNRFIKVFHSNFNIIPPSDVPPMTQAEEEEEQSFQQRQASRRFAAGGPGAGAVVAGRGSTVGKGPIGGRYGNMKYVAPRAGTASSSTPTSAGASAGAGSVAAPPSPSTTSGANDSTEGMVTDGGEGADLEGSGGGSGATTSDSPEGDEGGEGGEGQPAGSPAAAPIPTAAPSPRPRPLPSPAAAKADRALHQQFEELVKTREQADAILKKKEELLQAQIDQIRTMIAKLEGAADSDSKRDMVEDFEGKIVGLQTQLRNVRDQRERAAKPQTGGRGGAGGGYAGGGRYGARFAGARGGRRGGGRVGGGGFRATNLVLDNRPKALLVVAPPLGFEDRIEAHFSRFGEVKNHSMQPEGNIVVEFGNRKSAEVAKAQGAMYDGGVLVLDWHHAANTQSSDNA